ncbi:MAG: cation transporter [Phycisphaerales bacterium]|nr:MAG: cation transporter [Phycisphaerales bacterium]
MRRSAAMRAAYVALGANLLLFALKASATELSDSLTIFSETLNSLADVVSALVILACVRWAWKRPDEGHPFGHRRAEPIAGLLVAIFAGILGYEVSKTAVLDLAHGQFAERIGPYPIVALCITAVLKALLWRYFAHRGRRLDSPALRATAVDCRNDVFVALQGLVAVVVAELRLPLLDTLAAILVGGYILYGAYRIAVENVDYLMGRAPEPHMVERIRQAAAGVPGVRDVGHIKGHYVGTMIHVELAAYVDGDLSTTDSHNLCEATRSAVESIDAIDRAFVHISPVGRTG